jgi:nitrogen fixation protein
MEDNREGKIHVDRSLLDRRHYDPYVKRLQEKMTLASQIQKDQIEEYIMHLNQIATQQNSIILKKGGKVEFPESQFAILEKETRSNFKKKFKAYATE